MALKAATINIGGTDKVMRERQRVEILRNVGLQSLAVDRETRVTEAA
jgi:hypothetical protein